MNAVRPATTGSALPAVPWPRVKLGEVCEVAAGDSAPQDKALFTGGTIPFVRTSDVGAIHFGVLHDSRDHLTERGATGLRRFRPGSILFPKSGASTFLDHRVLLEVKACVASHLAVISPNPVLDSRYLLFALSQVKARDLLQDSSYPALRASEIEQISLPLPPLSVQRSIVARLDAELARADRMRDSFLALAESAAARFRAILAETFEQGETGDSGDSWPRQQLGDVCSLQRGKVISQKYLDQHPGPYPVYSSQTKCEGIFGRMDTFAFDGEYLTWTTDGANAGSVFYHKGRFSITNVCGLIEPNKAWLDARCLLYYLQLVAKKYVNKSMGNPKLMSNVVAHIPVPLPPLSVQRSIVARLDTARAECDRIEALARKGAEECAGLRAALLKEAFE